MADESTPSGLGAFFGGFATGRAIQGNQRGMGRSVDRLETTVDRLNDALERLTAQVNSSGGAGSRATPTGGGTQTAGRGNGGSPSFGGIGGMPNVGGHPAGAGPGWNAGHGAPPSRPNGGAGVPPPPGSPPAPPGGGGGGSRSTAQTAGRVAAGAVIGGLAATAMYNGNHYSNQVAGQTIASQYAGGASWSDAYKSSIGNNWSAHSDADALQTAALLGRRGGAAMGTSLYQNQKYAVQSYSAVNPEISNAQGAQARLSLATAPSYNRLAGMGINPLDSKGQGDPRQLARQILNKMGAQNVKTREQVFANFGPSGNATITLNSWVANGLIPPDSVPVVESEMKNILLAQVSGMDYNRYSSLAKTAATGGNDGKHGKARDELTKAGIAADNLVQQERTRLGEKRETESETIEGFNAGVSAATETLDAFRGALNAILSIPGVGEAAGASSGFMGTGGMGGTINKLFSSGGGGLPGLAMGLLGGDGPASASSYNTVTTGKTTAVGSQGVASGGSARAAASKYNIGAVKPWVQAAADKVGPMFGISTIYGIGQRSGASDHPKGLALDYMCSTAQGNRLAPYMVANRKALSVSYVIWRQRIWSVNNPSWRQMEDRGSVTANHYDHVHVSFLASPTGDPGTATGGGGGMGAGGSAASKSGAMSMGAAATGADNGGSMFTSSGGSSGGGGIGGFSEVAALGLGGGGGGAGGMGGGGAPGATGGSVTVGSGGGGGGAGSPISNGIRTVTANIDWTRGKDKKQLAHLASTADILLIQEANDVNLRKSLPKGWKTNQDMRTSGTQGSAIAWNAEKLGNNIGKSGLHFGALQDQGRSNTRYLSYLDTNVNGQMVRMISGHFPLKSKGSQSEFEKNLREVINSRPKGAEWLVGTDSNSPLRALAHRLGGKASGQGIIGQITSKGLRTGGISIDNYGEKIGSTDHPSVGITIGTKGGGGGPLPNGGSPSQNQALGRAMAARQGWTGEQWNDLKQLWTKESGWRTNADNPSSSAYGIPQALTQLHGLGDQYKSDPRTQIAWGLNYIKGRYGNPSKAWDFWQKNNYYDQGAWNLKEDHDARVHKGEMILPSKVAAAVRDELTSPGIRDVLGGRSRGGKGGGGITFAPGSIVVKVNGGGITKRGAEQVGRSIVDQITADQRIKSLMEG